MNRLLTTIGLGVALAVVASPAAAQSVAVDVGIHAGPIHGRVVYRPSPVYQTPYRAYAQDYRYSDRRYEGRANKHLRKHERRWRKAQEKYDRRLRKINREQAKAEREYEREYQRWQRDVGRQRYRRY